MKDWKNHKVMVKILDLIDAITAVYEIRDDGKECQRGLYLDYRNWKYYIYKTMEDKKYFTSGCVFESYNLNEIKIYLTGFLDAL